MVAAVMEGWIILARPVWLAALPAAALPVLLAWLARRRGRRISATAAAVQCLALAAAVVALAQPRAAVGTRASAPNMLLIDASGSVRGQNETARELAFPVWAKVERFRFAGGISRDRRPAEIDATRIAPALRMIASRGPDGLGAAVIATDGRFTDTDWAGDAARVAKLGIDIFVVPLESPPADARIVAFSARRLSGEQVEVTVTASSNAPLKRTLTVTRAGLDGPLDERRLSLPADSPATVRLTDTVRPDAAAEYSARLDGDSVITENDSAAALVLPVRQTVAAVGIAPLVRPILAGIKHPVTFIPPRAAPETSAALAGFSGIIVADATGSALNAGRRLALAEYVRSGGGLVMIGTGPHETPADENDPLNRVLPLVANPFQRRPLHLAVLLDKSGSMAQPTARSPGRAAQIKFDLAAEAVVALKDHLTTKDQSKTPDALTVIAFADEPQAVYDSGGGPIDFAALRKALKRVRPSGSTRVTPAIEMALSRPAAARPGSPKSGGRTPMLLIVSDLKTEQFNPAEWAERFRLAGAKLAVVAVGKDSPAGGAPLEALAALLEAPCVKRDQLAGLAGIFAALVRRGRGDVIRRGRTRVAVAGALFDTNLTALPDLDAYILCGARKAAEVTVLAAGGDPILGIRRAGLGRCVCLAVPLSQTLNAAWVRSPATVKLISSAVRWSLRSANDPRFHVTLQRRGNLLQITVTARQTTGGTGVPPVKKKNMAETAMPRGTGVSPVGSDAPINGLSLTVDLAGAEQTRTVALDQTAPGRYEASAAWPADLPAAVAVRDEKGAAVWRGSAGRLYPQEYRFIGANHEGLRRLADLTGGRIVPARRVGHALRQSFRRRMTDLWPWLLGMALALMLGEWCIVRIARFARRTP